MFRLHASFSGRTKKSSPLMYGMAVHTVASCKTSFFFLAKLRTHYKVHKVLPIFGVYAKLEPSPKR